MHPQTARSPDGSSPELAAPPADPQGELARLRATIDRLEADLIAAQRLATWGSLSFIIAHEFKNLMTPLLAYSDFALSTGTPADMRRALERARVQVQRSVSVTERLLAAAKSEEHPLEPCSVASAVQEALGAAVRPFEKDGIELRVSVPEDLRVLAQFDLLAQVLLNLLLNARQAMKGSRGRLTVSAWRDDTHVVIDVCDTGKGIPPEQLENVINPFLAATDASKPDGWQSVGLGLNVCRVVAHRHGATVEALANEQRGVTFRLRWPAG